MRAPTHATRLSRSWSSVLAASSIASSWAASASTSLHSPGGHSRAARFAGQTDRGRAASPCFRAALLGPGVVDHVDRFPGAADTAQLIAGALPEAKAGLLWAARALGSTSRLARAQHLQCLLDSTLTRLVAFGVFNPAGVLLAVGVRQCLERRACYGVALERSGERLGQIDLPWSVVEPYLDLDRVASIDACPLANFAI